MYAPPYGILRWDKISELIDTFGQGLLWKGGGGYGGAILMTKTIITLEIKRGSSSLTLVCLNLSPSCQLNDMECFGNDLLIPLQNHHQAIFVDTF